MDAYSEKILTALRSCDDYELFYEDAEKQFPDTADFFNAVRYLKSHGLIRYIKNQDGFHLGIHLTHYGIHKKEIDRREFWHLFFTRYIPGFMTGIIASVLAGLATALLLRALGI